LPRTLRFYEDKDLLHPARQGQSRIYSYRDRARLQLILRGRRLGFSLVEIKEMLDLYTLGDGGVEQLRMTQRKARERIAALERQRTDIDAALEELREGSRMIENLLAQKGTAADAV
jgi:DNA-binding transcriptional MerR regulator